MLVCGRVSHKNAICSPTLASTSVYHLPAYVVLQRWAAGRAVVVVAPNDLRGACRLRDAGARSVHVVGPGVFDLGSAKEVEGLQYANSLEELRPRSAELVVAIETYPRLSAEERAAVLGEVERVLSVQGLFVARAVTERSAEPAAESVLDFWTLEDELKARFRRVFLLAELPWSGVSLAPIVDEGADTEPALALDEALLVEEPMPSHYLAVACRGAAPFGMEPALMGRCWMVPIHNEPVGDASDRQVMEVGLAERQVEIDGLRVRLAQADGVAAVQEAELATLSVAKARLEQALVEAKDRVRARTDECESLAAEREDLQARLETLLGEQTHANVQLEGALVQREDLQARVDALEGEQTRSSAQFEEVLVEREDLQARVEALNGEQLRTSARLAEAVVERKDLQTRVEALQGEELRTSLQLEQVLAEREDLRARVEVLHGERTRATAQLEQVLAEREGLQTRVEVLHGDCARTSAQLEQAHADRERTRQRAERFDAELEARRRQQTELEDLVAQKTAEGYRLGADVEILRARLEYQSSLLEQAKTREQELASTIAQSVEQGRLLTEATLERDRLREEHARRTQEIRELEARLWSVRELLQKEQIDKVRAEVEIQRLVERAERSQRGETESSAEVDRLSTELHAADVERAKLSAQLQSRDDEISWLQRETRGLASNGEDLERLRIQLAESTEDHLNTVSALKGQLGAKRAEFDRMVETVGELERSLAEQRAIAAEGQGQAAGLRMELERGTVEQESLRRKLREREQEFEELVTAHESNGREVFRLRQELAVATRANEQLELVLGSGREGGSRHVDMTEWPTTARDEVRQLQTEIVRQAKSHAEQRARQAASEVATTGSPNDRARIRRLELEIEVRAEEHEQMLWQLDYAEQRIWEMTDASDRNAARLAASLAHLERHKEQLEETTDELELTQKLLAAAQARVLEQERRLATERARSARLGATSGTTANESEEDFITLDDGLPSEVLGFIPLKSTPRPGESAPSEGRMTPSPHVVVEPIDDRDWPSDKGVSPAVRAIRTEAEAPHRSSPRTGDGGT